MKKFAILLMVSVLAASCIKSEPFLCRSLVMGYFTGGGDLAVDGGLVFHIVKTQVNIEAKPTDRVIALVDVMKQTGSSEKEYDVKLLDYTLPICKEALVASEVTDWDAVGNDPVAPVERWCSGGHLNMRVLYFYKPSSKTVHTLNLVYDDAASTVDTLFFSLRHNAFGETLGSDDVSEDEVAEDAVYASFPLAKYIPAGKDTVAVKISGTWYEANGGWYSEAAAPYSVVSKIWRDGE